MSNRSLLVEKASAAAIELNRQLNYLLDAYEHFELNSVHKMHRIEINELAASIKELGMLPTLIAIELRAWKEDAEPVHSRIGFEVNVLNEFYLHINSVHSYLSRKTKELSGFDIGKFTVSIAVIREANQLLGYPAAAK